MQTGLWQATFGYVRHHLADILDASRERRAARRELAALLARPSDHLIEDAGLSRTDLRALAGDWRG